MSGQSLASGADSGYRPVVRVLDRSDADHVACRSLIESADEPLIIPAPVLVEVDYWIHQRLNPGVLVALSGRNHVPRTSAA